jgi:hypothetical protein
MKLLLRSVLAAWERCIAAGTHAWTGPLQSGFQFSDNPEARERFDREARAISSLSHPNICHLYDVGSQDGTSYLLSGELQAAQTDLIL